MGATASSMALPGSLLDMAQKISGKASGKLFIVDLPVSIRVELSKQCLYSNCILVRGAVREDRLPLSPAPLGNALSPISVDTLESAPNFCRLHAVHHHHRKALAPVPLDQSTVTTYGVCVQR